MAGGMVRLNQSISFYLYAAKFQPKTSWIVFFTIRRKLSEILQQGATAVGKYCPMGKNLKQVKTLKVRGHVYVLSVLIGEKEFRKAHLLICCEVDIWLQGCSCLQGAFVLCTQVEWQPAVGGWGLEEALRPGSELLRHSSSAETACRSNWNITDHCGEQQLLIFSQPIREQLGSTAEGNGKKSSNSNPAS